MLIALLPLAFAAPPPVFSYSRPEGADADDLSTYTFAKWPAKTTLYAATGTDVLDAPGGTRVGVLGFGEQVRIEESGAVAVVADRVDQWYRVTGEHTGWVFGGDLTPSRWEVDMDLDGEKELVTVAWMADFSVRVRVLEPNLRAGGMMQIDLEPAGGGYISQVGATATADLVPASKSGIPLVHVRVGVEACADYREDWVSYQAPAAVKIGSARLALSLGGLIDPPNDSQFEVTFSGKRKTAYVTRTTVQEEGQDPTVESTRYVLRDGVFLQESNGAVIR